jgi:histidine ammonia-lyase
MNLNCNKIQIEDLVRVTRKKETLTISPEVKTQVIKARKAVDSAVSNKKVIYGITTGFGAFKNKIINEAETKKLQENLILSHSVGVGNFLPTEVVRGMMFLIANYLLKGHSGVTWNTVETIVQMLNRGVHPLIPEKGSVGSSGDLAPSAHMVLVLIGKGEAEYHGKIMLGSEAMKKAGIRPMVLNSKEGLALINNTSTMSSIASHVLYDSKWILDLADACAALSLQALRGTDKAYDSRIHELKAHDGQVITAKNLRNLLKGSTFVDKTRVQEAYSFRCVPQIHGAIREAYSYANKVVSTEINSVTDNPLIFTDGDIEVISGGNFHGEPVAIAMDSMGIALSEIANVSDRRIATLLDPANNNGLPPFLTINGGLNSGFMILQYTTAALVSENKILAHPASVDSIPTSANIEDFVSMGTIAARKASSILDNVKSVLVIELMASCQAIDIRRKTCAEKLVLSNKTGVIYKKVREIVPFFGEDTVYYPYMRALKEALPHLIEE